MKAVKCCAEWILITLVIFFHSLQCITKHSHSYTKVYDIVNISGKTWAFLYHKLQREPSDVVGTS